MMICRHFIALLFVGALFGACAQSPQTQTSATQSTDSLYTFGNPTSADGTGKFYFGRDIAQVMGHLGAGWLERSEREKEERTDLLIDALALKQDDVVADIGAGSGYFTFRMSPLVPQGKVLAVDIQPEMLQMIEEKEQKQQIKNIETVLGTIEDPKLPKGSVDWVLLVDAYHEFSHPYEMMLAIAESLSPTGKVALVEYRAEDPSVPIKPRHKMTEAQAVKEMEAVGLELVENKDLLPQQHLMIFQRE
ncbi:class I SAM-dependent methyltransferase [Tunicatimonas pelagia]|uniref:class I SAM-dependent methyltransferase n=1 Tax=Tunicatimonas pelagia TaxID=931531 RepID=UPI00345C7352